MDIIIFTGFTILAIAAFACGIKVGMVVERDRGSGPAPRQPGLPGLPFPPSLGPGDGDHQERQAERRPMP